MLVKEVTLAADGACKKNPGQGGWACILRCDGHEKVLQGTEPDTTNNRMELRAVIEGFKALKEPVAVTVVTDSKYVTNAYSERWLAKWKTNGWMTNAGPVKNQDLWQELDALVQMHQVKWVWVKSHSKNTDDYSVLNSRVDVLAQKEAGTYKGD